MSDPTTRIDTADVLAVDAAVARASGAAAFGVTAEGFVPKPFARLLAEKLALARGLFGDELDLGSGSAIRKLLEVSALEDARAWAALAGMYDNLFVVSAGGEALSRLGDELGLARPFLEARGRVRLRLDGDLPAGRTAITLPRGARLLSSGGHHAALDEPVTLSAAERQREVTVTAFYPGPGHNLNPAQEAGGAFPQRLDQLNFVDVKLAGLLAARQAALDAGSPFDVLVEHEQPLAGGELRWPDARYRDMLLRAPRSIWTVDAVRLAASLVPGVRQVQVQDGRGGLDINQSIFGNFSFIERLFGTERDLGSPYYFSVLVAPTDAAIWEGPDGLRAAVEAAMENLRPIGIFPRVEQAEEVFVGVGADLVLRGLPLPSGTRAAINASPAAVALKARLLERVRRYIADLPFGEPVRAAEMLWALMNEPGVADVRGLTLLRYPPGFIPGATGAAPTVFDCGQNVDLRANQIAVFVDDPSRLAII
jgi:hypothetical protein